MAWIIKSEKKWFSVILCRSYIHMGNISYYDISYSRLRTGQNFIKLWEKMKAHIMFVKLETLEKKILFVGVEGYSQQWLGVISGSLIEKCSWWSLGTIWDVRYQTQVGQYKASSLSILTVGPTLELFCKTIAVVFVTNLFSYHYWWYSFYIISCPFVGFYIVMWF